MTTSEGHDARLEELLDTVREALREGRRALVKGSPRYLSVQEFHDAVDEMAAAIVAVDDYIASLRAPAAGSGEALAGLLREYRDSVSGCLNGSNCKACLWCRADAALRTAAEPREPDAEDAEFGPVIITEADRDEVPAPSREPDASADPEAREHSADPSIGNVVTAIEEAVGVLYLARGELLALLAPTPERAPEPEGRVCPSPVFLREIANWFDSPDAPSFKVLFAAGGSPGYLLRCIADGLERAERAPQPEE